MEQRIHLRRCRELSPENCAGDILFGKSKNPLVVLSAEVLAFGADIGGNQIGHDCIYSGAKTSALNTNRGFYLGSDGQVGFGDTNEYIQFYKGDDGNFHLTKYR